MRIAKSTHLKRLLQVQDTLLGTLMFLLVVNFLFWFGWTDRATTMSLLFFAPLVFVSNIFASSLGTKGLHGISIPMHAYNALIHTAFVTACVVGIAYLARTEYVGRVLVVSYGVLLAMTLFANRLFLFWWYLHGRKESRDNFLKLLVIGSGARAERLISEYREHSKWGVEVIGLLDPDPARSGLQGLSVPVIGAVEDVHEILSTYVVDEVVVGLPRARISDIKAVADACREQGVCLKFMADIYEAAPGTISLEQLGEVPLLSFEPVAQDEGKLVAKRIFDLLVATASLPVIVPFFALVALAIKIDSKGPVFFPQQRVGLNKRPFYMFKFRSMVVDAEAKLKEIEHLNEADGPIFKMENDPRVTKIGHFIRRTSIDELPQIFNVLLGQMSLIGPRPMSMRDVDLFSKGVQRKRFSVRPGLLCLREVSGRSELSFDRWLELDLQYIDEWSLWLDLKILLRAVPAVLKGSGAS